MRRGAPLACVVLEIEPAAAGRATQALQANGRASDCVGARSAGSFAVLAPDTGPDGALKMAQRLSRAIEGSDEARVYAGYEAVADMRATPLTPASLLEHADLALRQARTTSGTSDGDRIRGYGA
jgi:GGDEF domain-containing protein